MLPSNTRLSKPIFNEVFTTGRLVHSGFFMLRMKKTTGLSRFAVSVSKKVAKSAVDRNRIRRRTYSALEALLKETPKLAIPIHTVLIAKDTVKKAQTSEILVDIREVFVKNSILE